MNAAEWFQTPALKARFVDDVLDLLPSTGEQSISFLLSEMRQMKGWRGIGTLGNFESLLEEAGFCFRREYKTAFGGRTSYLVRTYVTV